MTTREEWLEERKMGIGGSDCATIMGLNPYKTNVELWEEKTGKKEAIDISDKPYVKYGIKMEDNLRQSFAIKHPEFEIVHKENTIIRHPKFPFLFASLDGTLIRIQTREKGILEIKTTTIRSAKQKEIWKDGIPSNYYCQVLHYMNVVDAKFARLFAEITYAEDYQALKTYEIERDEQVEDDIKELEKAEIIFWNEYVLKDRKPPLILPEI